MMEHYEHLFSTKVISSAVDVKYEVDLEFCQFRPKATILNELKPLLPDCLDLKIHCDKIQFLFYQICLMKQFTSGSV